MPIKSHSYVKYFARSIVMSSILKWIGTILARDNYSIVMSSILWDGENLVIPGIIAKCRIWGERTNPPALPVIWGNRGFFVFVLEETFVTLCYAHCTVNQSAKAFHLPVLSGVPLCCRLWHSVTCAHKYIVCNAGKGTFKGHYHRAYQFW